MKQATYYARTSSQKQREEKTIESQSAELKELISRDGNKLVKEYLDDGWSGATLARPALDELRDDAEKGFFDVVYFYDSSRLSRDNIDQAVVLRELRKNGVEVIFKDKPLTEENELSFDIEAVIAKHERKKILEITRRGRLHKARKGILVGAYPPFGYDYVLKTKTKEGYYKINKREAGIVRLIFNLYIQFQSIGRVNKELTDRKIKPRMRNGVNWSDSQLSRILSREDYIGTAYYNKTYSFEKENPKKRYSRIIKSGRALRDKNEWLPIKVPAIIEREKFDLVRHLVSKNSRPFGAKKHYYLLSGLGFLKHEECGKSLQADPCNGHSYYRCRQCGMMIPIEELDNPVWNFINNAMNHPDILIKRIAYLNEDTKRSTGLLNEEREDLLKEINKIKGKKNRLLGLYGDEGIEKEALMEQIGSLSQSDRELEIKLKQVAQKLAQVKSKPDLVKNFKEFCKLSKIQIQTLSNQQKRELLSLLLDKVSYSSKANEIKIEGCIPTEMNEEKESNLYGQSSSIVKMPQSV